MLVVGSVTVLICGFALVRIRQRQRNQAMSDIEIDPEIVAKSVVQDEYHIANFPSFTGSDGSWILEVDATAAAMERPPTENLSAKRIAKWRAHAQEDMIAQLGTHRNSWTI